MRKPKKYTVKQLNAAVRELWRIEAEIEGFPYKKGQKVTASPDHYRKYRAYISRILDVVNKG